MSPSLPLNTQKTVVITLIAALLFGCAAHSEHGGIRESTKLGKLGTVDFPTSCSAEAQSRFIRGLAALHSFWYSVALEEFRAATRIEPSCMMGYWGEAMAHNHPIWGDPQETEPARKVLAKLEPLPKLTAREEAYIKAVKILYGPGNKATRDKAYADAMERIHRDYPHDAEAALFYALALMGTVGAQDLAGMETRLRAAEIASRVFKEKPNHPGAAHYLIHAYDDPKHAHLALDAARRYAQIAPAAPHALHMPSHIFLQLGMWPEAAASNEASWAASDRWVETENLPISERDYHSLHWLQYVYLQQGRFDEAEKLLDVMRRSLADFSKQDMRNLMYGTYIEASMAAAYVIETENWKAAEKILGDVVPKPTELTTAENPEQALAAVARIPAIFASGLAAAMMGSPDADTRVAALREIGDAKMSAPIPFVKELQRAAKVQALEVSAAAHSTRRDFETAFKIMEQALAAIDALPPPVGPPFLIKPAHELFGEILLRADRPRKAAEQFAISLRRHANRARSLLGGARAFAQAGETRRATKLYGQLADQWQKAQAELPELRETRKHGGQAVAR